MNRAGLKRFAVTSRTRAFGVRELAPVFNRSGGPNAGASRRTPNQRVRAQRGCKAQPVLRAVALLVVLHAPALGAEPPALPRIRVSEDRTGFVLEPSGRPFTPWGVNYDRDHNGRLLEDYWNDEWSTVEGDFAEIKALGANVVRVHLQFGKFMDAADAPNAAALDRLAKLVALAQRVGLYLDLTGLGCYHKKDVPAWYDALSEQGRWDAQARFWQAVAGRCARSPAVFCYDLMNEPVVPGGRRKDRDWLGPAFGDKHYVQVITLDQRGRPRPEIARQWIGQLARAIRQIDPRHLITVGLVDWSLDRPGLTSGFVPDKVTGDLDFVCVHLYPETGKHDQALATLKGFAVGKPVVVEETFPLKCSSADLIRFIDDSRGLAAGWISFYWGRPAAELKRTGQLADAITADWLEQFSAHAPGR